MYFIISVLFCVFGYVLGGPYVVEPSLNIISRSEWGARKPVNPPTPLNTPIPEYVVIHHSATKSCSDEASCKKLVKSFQTYHIEHNEWNDIGYNFIVGEDGNVYEGRGWGIAGAHTPGYNSRSIGICITGNYVDHLPNQAALKAVQELIAYGIINQDITPLYKLIGHKQATATLCPGRTLYDEIKTWNHWFPNPKRGED